MASLCRSAIMAGSRSLASRSRTLNTLTGKVMSSPFSSSPTRVFPSAARVLSALGTVESLMPLHSAIASARLKSSIAMDSSCWSWLSQVTEAWDSVGGEASDLARTVYLNSSVGTRKCLLFRLQALLWP